MPMINDEQKGTIAMSVTYTPINKMDVGMWPMNYGSKLVKEATDIMFSIGVNDRDSVRSRLDALYATLNKLRDSIDDMEAADETAAGIPND